MAGEASGGPSPACDPGGGARGPEGGGGALTAGCCDDFAKFPGTGKDPGGLNASGPCGIVSVASGGPWGGRDIDTPGNGPAIGAAFVGNGSPTSSGDAFDDGAAPESGSNPSDASGLGATEPFATAAPKAASGAGGGPGAFLAKCAPRTSTCPGGGALIVGDTPSSPAGGAKGPGGGGGALRAGCNEVFANAPPAVKSAGADLAKFPAEEKDPGGLSAKGPCGIVSADGGPRGGIPGGGPEAPPALLNPS